MARRKLELFLIAGGIAFLAIMVLSDQRWLRALAAGGFVTLGVVWDRLVEGGDA
ncbi:MAG: hypothetical protein ABDI20_08780 [Candidatus Bipolaricaulaceae bacterium]